VPETACFALSLSRPTTQPLESDANGARCDGSLYGKLATVRETCLEKYIDRSTDPAIWDAPVFLFSIKCVTEEEITVCRKQDVFLLEVPASLSPHNLSSSPGGEGGVCVEETELHTTLRDILKNILCEHGQRRPV